MRGGRFSLAGISLTILLALALAFLPAAAQAAPPVNDDFADSQEFSGENLILGSNLAGATIEAGETATFGGYDLTGSVWFSWTAPRRGLARIRVSNAVIEVSTGSALASLSPVASNFGQVVFPAEASVTYRIAVANTAALGSPVAAFNLNLGLSTPPPNDQFADAEALSGSPASTSGTTSGATHETGEPYHGHENEALTVWYQWQAPASGQMIVDTCATDHSEFFITAVTVFTGNSLESISESGTGACKAVFAASSGTTYRISVETNNSFGIDFDLELRPRVVPSNDDFAGAEELTGPSDTTTGSLADAGVEQNEPEHNGKVNQASVWYSWTPPITGPASIKVSKSANLAIYEGSQIESLALDYQGDRSLRFPVSGGVTYRIAVASENGSRTGPFNLDAAVFTPPANDDFANAQTVAGFPATVSSDNRGATFESGEPQHQTANATASAWFNWTASQSGMVAIDACSKSDTGSNVARAVEVFTGAVLDSLTLVGTSHCSLSFSADSGSTYRIVVASYPDSSDPFTLRIRSYQPPANDNFSQAQTLSGSPVTVSGELVGGTVEANEPFQLLVPGFVLSSVWYQWVAPVSGQVQLDTANPSLALGVYTGTTLGSLTSLGFYPGEFSFTAQAGVKYWIAVGRVDDQTSGFTLSLDQGTLTLPDTTIDSRPAASINEDHATVAFHGSAENTFLVKCSLDSGEFVECASPLDLVALSEGNHTLSVRAEDGAGTPDPSPATVNFKVDLTAPTVGISSGPAGTTGSSSAHFSFTADEPGVTFQCSLDAGAFQPCADAVTFDSLGEGTHTLQVRGQDPAGNTSATAATRTWTYSAATTTVTTSGTVPAGGTMSTDPTGQGPSVDRPATMAISVPDGGEVSVTQQPASVGPPSGYTLVGQQFHITAPAASVERPLILSFRVLGSSLPGGYTLDQLTVLRDGLPAADCSTSDGTATPDPCVSARQVLVGGDVTLTVLSSHASDWNLAIAESPDSGAACEEAKAKLGEARKASADARTGVSKAGKSLAKAKKKLGKARKAHKKKSVKAAKKTVRKAKTGLAKARKTASKAGAAVSKAESAVKSAC